MLGLIAIKIEGAFLWWEIRILASKRVFFLIYFRMDILKVNLRIVTLLRSLLIFQEGDSIVIVILVLLWVVQLICFYPFHIPKLSSPECEGQSV